MKNSALEGFPNPAERREKGAQAFGGNYDSALAIRQFDRGWDLLDRGEKEQSPAYWLSRTTEQCINLAKDALAGKSEDNSQLWADISQKLQEVREGFLTFGAKNNSQFFESEIAQLAELQKAVQQGDNLNILVSAAKAKAYYSGLIHAADVWLEPADKASENLR